MNISSLPSLSSCIRFLDRWFVLLIFMLSLCFTWDYHKKGKNLDRVIHSDAEGYYLYLPAVFISGNFKDFPVIKCCKRKKDTKEVIDKYTYGVSVLELPFFLLSHAVAKATWTEAPAGWDKVQVKAWNQQWKPHGFSRWYALGILLSGCFYLALGMFFLQKVLRRYFQPEVVLITLASLFFGTNLFYYTIAEPGMSHVYNFFLFAAVLWMLPLWLAKPGLRNTLFLAFPLCLSILIRPTNIILAVFALPLWEVYRRHDLKERLKFLWRNIPALALMAGVFILISIPQMLYWKQIWGTWLKYSYQDEGFIYWNAPKLFSVLFSHQNGLFMYAPLLLIVFPGIFFSLKEKRLNGPLVLLLLTLATYIFASWWAWWFGGAYGHRCFVEFLTLMALPFGLVVEKVLNSKQKWLKTAFLIVLVHFSITSAELSYLYSPPWDGEAWTFERYGEIFLRAMQWWK